MQIQENISLKALNTFGIGATAKYYAGFSNRQDLDELASSISLPGSRVSNCPILILGGGSNILLTKNFEGLVLRNEIKGVTELHEDAEHVYIRAGAGENWHEFVQHCLKRDWAGLENLSLIPGNVGASPMQNIGAYGVELAEVFHALTAYHIGDKKTVVFSAADCAFGYRESVFKQQFKNQFIITNVTLRLRKQ